MVFSVVLKPMADADILYNPAGIFWMLYFPALSVIFPIDVFKTEIVALGIGKPSDFTVPDKEPSWAIVFRERTINPKRMMKVLWLGYLKCIS
jgi:hypothetical protein